MTEEENRDAEEMGEEELDELFEQHIKRREDPKHRGYGDYERRRIYKGPSVKRE
ncbi:hypothetical protein [uncultured Methanolobus sp.]|uniref:hypothetical protein n=1 Tax=uncultured Methanolobus sp. TaxID=218300 RepID=UPI002AAB46C2|nr:hypothetical protein [uncultured Methanolobus sp.]